MKLDMDVAQMRPQLVGSSEERIDLKSSPSQPGYGLRENPRKTWRAEDLKTPPLIDEQKERICKQCGKGFRSMKALCGHMACHSEKDRFLKEDYSWTSERVGGDSISEAEDRKRPKRAATKRYTKAKLFSESDNDSSSVSEIDFELEEVAMCLIMLSKDDKNWVGVGSNQDSSNSVILETKSPSIHLKIGRQRDQDYVNENTEIVELGKGKSKSGVFSSANEDESTEGYFTVNDFKKRKPESGSKFKALDTELGKKLKKNKSRVAELGIALFKGKECDKSGSDSKIMKLISKNKKNLKCKKKTKAHECPYCNRVFKSGQALGGHKRSHFLGNSGNRNNTITTGFEAESSEAKDLLDLNLPAPEEEEERERSQFVNW